MKPLVAGGLGALGLSQWPSMGPHYMTDQGIPIPAMTELAKTGSFGGYALPLVGTLGLMALLGHDYQNRMQEGIPIGHPGLPMSRRLLDYVEEAASDHPLITAGVGTLGLKALGGSRLGQWANRRVVNPLMDIGGDVANKSKDVIRRVAEGGTKISSWLQDEMPALTDTVLLPEINLDRLAEKLGELIVEG